MTREEILDGLYEIKNWKCNGDVKTHEVVVEAIKALEQEPTTKNDLGGDCISRAYLLDDSKYHTVFNDDTGNFEDVVYREDIEKAPPIMPQEPKIGHWIENAPEYQNIDPPYICSECGYMHLRKTNYCDQCGAKMVEPQESEDKE